MNDPHVESLIYRVSHWETVSFDDAEPLEFETSFFSVHVKDGTARFTFNEHYDNAEAARAVIEPFIEIWEMWDALNPELSGFKLEYVKPEIIDRKPPSGNSGNQILPSFTSSASGPQNNGRRYYPFPPCEQVALNADVKVMAYRFWLYRQRRDTLAAMVNFCLTVLENSTGYKGQKRKRAAKQYNVELPVLKKLGDLSANKGGRDARKVDGLANDYSQSETNWMELTIKKLIERAADIAEDPNQQLPIITMGEYHPF